MLHGSESCNTVGAIDDPTPEMPWRPFDRDMADSVFGGRLDPDDAPPELREVARLVRAATGPASPSELSAQSAVVAAFGEAVRGSSGVSLGKAPHGAETRRKTMIGKLLSAKVIAAAATVAVGGVAAAAATGSLPAPIQAAVSSGLSNIGVSVPNPNSTTTTVAGSGGQGKLPAGFASGANLFGQCTAYEASQRLGGTGATTTTSPSGGAGGSSAGANTSPMVAGTSTSTTSAGTGGTTSTVGASQGPSFQYLSAEAQAKGESVAQLCASATKPGKGSSQSGGHRPSNGGPPSSLPGQGNAGGPPSSLPGQGNHPSGPPSSLPGSGGNR